MRNYIKLLLPALAAAALIAGCGGGNSKTVKVPGGGEVSVGDKVPDNFPKDFPVYKGAKVQGSFKSTEKGVSGYAVNWETSDSVDKVKEFYVSEFEKGPWTASGTFESGDTATYGVTNKDGTKEGSLIIGSSDGKTSITAFVGDASESSSDSSGGDSSSGNGSTTKKTPTPESEDSSSSDSSAQKSPTPSQLPTEAKLSKDFPSDRVPLPSGARVTSSSSFGNADSRTFIIEVYVKDAPDKVADYFATELPKHGWTDSYSSESDGVYSASYTDDQSSSVIVSAEQSDTPGYTKVSLSVSTSAATP